MKTRSHRGASQAHLQSFDPPPPVATRVHEAERERQLLIEAGFERDPDFFGWSMTDFRGEKFTVTERAIRTHDGFGPVRWVPPWELKFVTGYKIY